MTPLFSIIVPTYNRASFLTRTITSVLNQKFEDWELIIVDDGSTDDTIERVEGYKDERIRYFYQENAERSAARNNGIQNANGEWICFLDSDDEYREDHLAVLKSYIDANSLQNGMIVTGIEILENGKKTSKRMLNDKAKNILKEIWSTFIFPTQVCIHRTCLEQNKFDTRYRIWEDTHLFLRIAAHHPVYAIDEYTCILNKHDESTVSKGFNNVRIAEVIQYVDAIRDVQSNSEVSGFFNASDFKHYIDSKYRMYLYQARQNKQIGTGIKIWWKGFMHRPSFYLLLELPKIFINAVGIGLHG